MTRAEELFQQMAKEEGYGEQEISSFLQSQPEQEPYDPNSNMSYYADQLNPSGKVIPPSEVTQTYGQPSQYDVFSGNVNTGVDFATPEGTPLNAPDGEWDVEDAFSGDTTPGYIGNNSNQGYGNSVVLVNPQTKEKIRFSHLKDVKVTPGMRVKGGQIGSTGRTGNVTGPHLDTEYYDPSGQMGDILSSPYAKLFQ